MAKKTYPELAPTRPGGFSGGGEGPPTVLITGYDESVVMVIRGKDLYKLKGMIDLALRES